MVNFRIGADIGGTFTDLVLLGQDGTLHTKKVPSSVDDYARAIVEGVADVFAEAGIGPDSIHEIRHGTTVASNAILEHKGARVGLITLAGMEIALSDLLGRKVEMHTVKGLHPRFRNEVLDLAEVQYEQA